MASESRRRGTGSTLPALAASGRMTRNLTNRDWDGGDARGGEYDEPATGMAALGEADSSTRPNRDADAGRGCHVFLPRLKKHLSDAGSNLQPVRSGP